MKKDPYKIILHPYTTEKTMNQMQKPTAKELPDGNKNLNKLHFVVSKNATKPEIKKAIEELLGAKITKINTKITNRGKIAIVRFAKDYSAEELGSRIGVF